MKTIASLVLACALGSSFVAHAASNEGFTLTPPESVGFSSERLQRLKDATHQIVDAGELSGMVTLVTRHGQLVYSDVYGVQDVASQKPMTPDTIFRIYSMTKPIVGVAMMILYEEGKWLPDDPLSKHIPELANLKVFAGLDA
jgi:CubicO group peptidase (beta-lactamase class C family)